MNRQLVCWLLTMMATTLPLERTIIDRSEIFEPLTQLTAQQKSWQVDAALEEAYKRARDAEDMFAAAALIAATGWSNHEQKPQEALKYFERAMETLHKATFDNRDDRIIREVLGGRGKSYQAGPRTPVDLEWWDPGYPPEFVSTEHAAQRLDTGLMLDIGVGYAVQGQYDIAQQWWVECRNAARNNRFSDLERSALTNLAWLAHLRVNSRQALEYLNAAIKIGSRPGEPGLVPSQQLKHIWLLQGVRFLDAKRLPDAIATLRTAVQLYESAGGDDRGRPVAHLATALALSNELSEARATYEQALALSISDFETQWHAQCGLADIYRRTNEMSKAVDAYRDCVALIQGRAGSFATDEGKVAFLGGFQNIYDSYLEVAFTQSTLTHDWVSLRNAVETLRGRSTDALVDFRRRQALGTPGLLGAYDLGLPGEQSIRSQFAPSLPNPENVAAIVPQLEDDSAERLVEKSVTFLEYYVLQERTLVLVHTPDGVVHASSTLGRDRLRNLVQRYRHAIGQDTNRSFQVRRNLRLPTSKGSEDPNTMGADLYRALIEPVKSLLPGSEAPLVIVPHDVLWDVPFEALPVGGKEYVVDKYLISYASSSRQWSRQAAAKRPADHRDVHAWVIGNPRIDTPITACGETAQFDNLPGAEDEAKSIAAQIGRDRSDLFIGSAADRLRFLAWHPNYSVIHIAAHGFVCPTNPNASGILLASLSRQEIVKNAEGKLEVAADRRLSVELVNPEIIPKLFAVSGLLTAEQIALRFRFQADLVFLSACQSGAGAISGEGLLGFARAFEGAGARSLVLSLWLVGDQSARFLTSEFYAQYLKHGDKAKALRQAMLATRKMYPRVEDWAAFRLIGPGE